MDRKVLIAQLTEELRTTKYNKRTQHHIGLVKAKIARLKRELQVESKKGGKHLGFAVKKTGDATVVMVGLPSVGKSTLLNALTNAKSEVGAYDFTTINVIPGTLIQHGAKIQILDVPGIITGAARGVGRGREVFSVIKAADLIMIVLDDRSYSMQKILKQELYNADIRMNEQPPDVTVERQGFGGIDFGTTVRLTKTDEETIKGMMREMGFANASIVIRQDISQDQLLDVLAANRVYVPAITVVNKLDVMTQKLKQRIENAVGPDLFISSEKRTNIEKLREMVFRKLGLIRIYMKHPSKEPDMDKPMIMHEGDTIADVCKKIHMDILKNLRYARVWGSSKFPGQKLGTKYQLKDKDIVQLVLG